MNEPMWPLWHLGCEPEPDAPKEPEKPVEPEPAKPVGWSQESASKLFRQGRMRL